MSGLLLRIGALAAQTGTSADSIRHYERLGLLPAPARTDGGYRMYPAAALDRVRLIRSAVRAGFALKDLQKFLTQRDAGEAPCRKVKAAAEQILEGVDRQIADLQEARANLQAMLHDWEGRLATTPGGRPARLLDALPQAPASDGGPATHLKRRRR